MRFAIIAQLLIIINLNTAPFEVSTVGQEGGFQYYLLSLRRLHEICHAYGQSVVRVGE